MKFFSKIFLGFFCLSSLAMGVERSPFTDVVYDGDYVKVKYEEKEYYLLSINGVRRVEIMKRCQETYFDSCKMHFAEKFSSTMKEIGLGIGETISLSLLSPQP